MRKRRLLVGVGALVLLVVVGWLAVAWLAPSRPGITRENYERIQQGMTQHEVERLLGEPGQDGLALLLTGPEHESDALATSLSEIDDLVWGEPPTCLVLGWVGRDVIVLVRFDNGRVSRKDILSRPQQTFLGRLRRLLPW
jgi:hypothetical protein